MIRHIFSAMAAAATLLMLGAGAATAQEIDFASEANRVWWNGVTPNELQELAVEAGATHTSVSAGEGLVVSRIEWPDIGVVQAWQGTCTWNGEVVDRDANCSELILIYDTVLPSDMERFRASAPIWLTSTVGDQAQLRLHRYDVYAYGTSRGRVLAELMMFKVHVATAVELIDQIGPGSGW